MNANKTLVTSRIIRCAILALLIGGLWTTLKNAEASRRVQVRSPFGLPLPAPRAGTARAAMATPAQTSNISFSFGMIDFPGSVDSGAFGVNKAGHIVGGYGPELPQINSANSGFALSKTNFKAINFPGAVETTAYGINNQGIIVGDYANSGGGVPPFHGFELSGSTFTSFDYPGAMQTIPFHSNKTGTIVGVYSDANGGSHGFTLLNGTFTNLDVPGASYTVAEGINSAGVIVGSYADSNFNTHGFILQSGTFTRVDYPGAQQTALSDINDNNEIAGIWGGTPVTLGGFEYLWQHGFLLSQGTYTTFDAPFGKPPVTWVYSLSNSTTVVGLYVDNSATVYGYEAKVGP